MMRKVSLANVRVHTERQRDTAAYRYINYKNASIFFTIDTLYHNVTKEATIHSQDCETTVLPNTHFSKRKDGGKQPADNRMRHQARIL